MRSWEEAADQSQYAGASSVAGFLRGLTVGSRLVNPRKGGTPAHRSLASVVSVRPALTYTMHSLVSERPPSQCCGTGWCVTASERVKLDKLQTRAHTHIHTYRKTSSHMQEIGCPGMCFLSRSPFYARRFLGRILISTSPYSPRCLQLVQAS